AAGIIALLDERDPEVKLFALGRLNEVVDIFWHEISEYVTKIEVIYEDSAFKHRDLAALVASKVYYHLGAFDESVSYALCAGKKFNVHDSTEYVETIVEKCIDLYIKQRVQDAESTALTSAKMIDNNLVGVVDQMFKRCFDDKQYKQAVGIALECRRMDIFEKAILESDDVAGMLLYTFKVSLSLIQSRRFRDIVLNSLVNLYKNLTVPDYISVCQCLIFLDQPMEVATILEKLIQKNEESAVMAYQIGFDLYESATQQFLQRVQGALRLTSAGLAVSAAAAVAVPSSTAATTTATSTSANASASAVTASATLSNLSCECDKAVKERMTKLLSILNGDVTISLHLQFLIKTNKTDGLVLKNTKDVIRNSICHNATVIANSFMHCGTTCDQFLRDNLDWLGRATNWAKFTATASLGTIHKGHEKEALRLMSTYLPKDSGPGSAYSEGGGLYALGLIHANHGGEITEYLLNQSKEAVTDAIRHGACLGLGLAAMGTSRDDIYEQLKLNLFQDDAVTGEAAGIAMGLVMLGTGSTNAASDMITYARDTQHEKIMRGLAIGIALLQYGRLEDADGWIQELSSDKDSILRWCAAYCIAMAYCGTGNNGAVKQLLHMAVSDVSDDVRRAAVTSLGFLLFRVPEQCPGIVSLLSESFNPHVRYGSAMALGVACAGTGLKEALVLLEPLTNDPVNYVRQGALIASALILIQHNDNTCPKVSHYRQLYAKVISDKHEDVMAKFGAILAQGIIDAGGRNTTINLQSRTGHTNMVAVIGLLIFLQFWYWYPLTHFLSLALTSTALIGLNADLNMPVLDFKSNAKPSIFAYPPNLEEKKDKNKEKVETAVLSITAKQQKRKGTAGDKKKEEKMEVGAKKEDETSTKKKEAEPNFEMLANPARIMKAQLKVLSMPAGSRYIPLKDVSVGGIIMLKNARPQEPEVIIELVETGGPKPEDEVEPEPFEPFEWNED
ncbi:hypothetical protein HELRODRAFT_71906, partial [Helobdella robusta]|uniref:26S proteasome non-ATPase regulatory subunit 1 n=1 Tax=Helobdella robusta TaxID=6412 RepID=T1G0S8_HELRO